MDLGWDLRFCPPHTVYSVTIHQCTYRRLRLELLCCGPNLFNHIIKHCRLRLDNPIMLVVVVPSEVKHARPNEFDYSEVRVPLMGDWLSIGAEAGVENEHTCIPCRESTAIQAVFSASCQPYFLHLPHVQQWLSLLPQPTACRVGCSEL